jgi:hypothetical protein
MPVLFFRQVHKYNDIDFLSVFLGGGGMLLFRLVQLHSQEVYLCFRRETDCKALFKAIGVWRLITSVCLTGKKVVLKRNK